jgi:hypothetical protein
MIATARRESASAVEGVSSLEEIRRVTGEWLA